MGYKLRREVRDALPPGLLTAAERNLILEVADNANDDTRRGYPGREEIARLADLAESSVPTMLARIAEKWIDVRVPVGKDSKGRPVYGRQGHRTVFEFPLVLPRFDDGLTLRSDDRLTLEPGRLDDGQAKVGPPSHQRLDARQAKVGPSSTPSPQIPSGISSSRLRTAALPRADAPRQRQRQQQDPIQTILDNTDAKPAEAEGYTKALATDPKVKTVGGFIKHLADAGDLQTRLDEWRAAEQASTQADKKGRRDRILEVLRVTVIDQPECQHGCRGGDIAFIEDKIMKCPRCRSESDSATWRDVRDNPTVLTRIFQKFEERGLDDELRALIDSMTPEQIHAQDEAERILG